MWYSWCLPPDNLWILDMKLLAALEALQGFEAVVPVFFQQEFLTTVSRGSFGQIYIAWEWQSLFCLSWGLFSPRPPCSQEIYMHGWWKRGGGNSRVWDRERIIIPRFRWVQPCSVSWSQVQRWSAGSLAVAGMPFLCRQLQKWHGSSPEQLNCIDLFFPTVAARHFERSTLRSRSFKKINKAFSVLRRTTSGSAVSSQAGQERETVRNSAVGGEGNVLLLTCYHLERGRGPYPCGNLMSMTDMPFMWWAVHD